MKKFLWVLVAVVAVSAVPSYAVSAFNLPWMNAEQNGMNYSSTSHPQGVFVVEAYFLNCPYCNYNAKRVNALAAKYAEEARVQVLDVGIDKSDSQYATWIQRHKPNHPVLKDAKRTLINQLGTASYPSTYVMDCKGRVVFSSEGEWGPEEIADIEEAIEGLLEKECL